MSETKTGYFNLNEGRIPNEKWGKIYSRFVFSILYGCSFTN
ncbi:hypothetical protein BN424_305 [Carnobacterium maltaromaticum LMA28]|uniref:Uncharacterized protein n=1 Tax=Carnobacterium maltaromaticum LMA28 TaxID=1234679 RepID=K8E1U8_CARML|nr:hypothetical protein BN424_305 [Carnobacterium maltaromaticum LMA28]